MAITVAIAASSNGANQIVAAKAGKRYRVLAFQLSFSGTVNAKWQSAANDMTGLFYGVANIQVASPQVPTGAGNISVGQFTTNTNEALNLNLSAGVAVGGYVIYEETT